MLGQNESWASLFFIGTKSAGKSHVFAPEAKLFTEIVETRREFGIIHGHRVGQKIGEAAHFRAQSSRLGASKCAFPFLSMSCMNCVVYQLYRRKLRGPEPSSVTPVPLCTIPQTIADINQYHQRIPPGAGVGMGYGQQVAVPSGRIFKVGPSREVAPSPSS